MRINLPSSCATLHIDLSQLPLEHHNKGNRGAGIFLLLFSLLWGGIPTFFLVTSLANGQFEPGMLLILIFTIIGTALFLFALKLVTTRQVIRFEPDRISLDEKSIFGHTVWSEPLKNYPGIHARSEYHSGGKNRSSYTLYIVELYHEDKKKRIRLYESRYEFGFRGIHETYCYQLNLPALAKDGNEMVSRKVEDLDKSVKELAREGKLEFAFDPMRTPPEGIDMQRIDDKHLQIDLPKIKIPILLKLILLTLPAIFIYVGFGIEEAPIVFGIIGTIFFIVVTGIIFWYATVHRVVVIGPETIHTFYQTPWGETSKTTFDTEGIEEVRIGRATKNTGSPGVLLVTDECTRTIGDHLPKESLEWLRNCILWAITR